MWWELGALTKAERSLGSGLSYSGEPQRDAWHLAHCLSGCLTHVNGRLTCYLLVRLTCLTPWQSYVMHALGTSMADSLAPHLYPKCCIYVVLEGAMREACQGAQTSIRLASYLVREPNSISGGHEFGSEQCSTNKVPLSADIHDVDSLLWIQWIQELWRLVDGKLRYKGFPTGGILFRG